MEVGNEVEDGIPVTLGRKRERGRVYIDGREYSYWRLLYVVYVGSHKLDLRLSRRCGIVNMLITCKVTVSSHLIT